MALLVSCIGAIIISSVGAFLFFSTGSSVLPICAYSLWGASALCIAADLAVYYHIQRRSQQPAPVPVSQNQTAPGEIPPGDESAYPFPLGEEQDYNAYPETVSKPLSTSQFLRQTMVNQQIREQGDALEKDFYYQKARGGGNCFYLSYLSGLLHYLVATKDDEQFGILLTKLQKGPETTEKERCLYSLQQLQQNPTAENLYRLIGDGVTFTAMVLYLRQYAVNLVSQSELDDCFFTEPAELARDPRIFRYSLNRNKRNHLSNADLEQIDQEIYRTYPGKTIKERYCTYQAGDGIDVQDHEIRALYNSLFPIRLYFRLNTPEGQTLRQQQGLKPSYSPDSPLTLFNAGNHFDVLLPKKYTRYTPDFSKPVGY